MERAKLPKKSNWAHLSNVYYQDGSSSYGALILNSVFIGNNTALLSTLTLILMKLIMQQNLQLLQPARPFQIVYA